MVDRYTVLAFNSGLSVTSNIPLIWSPLDRNYRANLTGSHLNTTIELTCLPGARGLEPHTQLQWWDEMIPLVDSDRRQLISTQDCGLTLRLHGFSMLDYGRYRCKCLKEQHEFDRGIQFNLERVWGHECSETETVVNLIPRYSKMSRL